MISLYYFYKRKNKKKFLFILFLFDNSAQLKVLRNMAQHFRNFFVIV
jgi:hypothetical protein